MSRPGTTFTRGTRRASRSAPTRTGPWFIAGPTATADTLGAAGARVPVNSMSDYTTRFGGRTGAAIPTYDAVEFHLKEGSDSIYIVPAAIGGSAAITATNVETALALFTRDLGPGQVSVPDNRAPESQAKAIVHAFNNNRVAVLGSPNTGTAATILAHITALEGLVTAEQLRYAALFVPDIIVPGVTAGTTRTIDPTSIVTGLMARRDAEGVSPNQPAAGQLGESAEGLDTTFSFTDADRSTLNLNGANVVRDMFDGVRVYGYRTLADPATDPEWINLGHARLFMAVQAEFDVISERYVFRQLDGRRKTIEEFGGVLTGALLPYFNKGSLYGVTPDAAFNVDVGIDVNTEATIAAGQLKARVTVRPSEFAEEVVLDLVKVRTTEAVA